MNINDFERLDSDPAFRDRVARAHFYKSGKMADPHFVALWAEVPQEVKDHHAQIGLEVIFCALVDDYTTPGCDCRYCTWLSDESHGRPIMCQQRWMRLPREARMEIADSCSG